MQLGPTPCTREDFRANTGDIAKRERDSWSIRVHDKP